MSTREAKLTPPTTVRLAPELHVWLQDVADARNDKRGRSGVINDALRHYKEHCEEDARSIAAVIGRR